MRMDELVKVHPLYSQLARLDDDMAALQLKAVGSEIARSGADVDKEEHALQHELDAAAARTKAALAGKEQEYTQREQLVFHGLKRGEHGLAVIGHPLIVRRARLQAR